MSFRNIHKRAAVGAVLAAGVLAVSACGTSDGAAAPATPTPVATKAAVVPVVKDILDTDLTPPGAPGRTLTLIRYTIAPGAKLAPHTHPGVQMASISEGTLTYTVVSGVAKVRRAGATAQTPIKGRSTIELGRGDAVIEVAGMVHFGENKTSSPVIILATLLTEDGHPLSEPVPSG